MKRKRERNLCTCSRRLRGTDHYRVKIPGGRTVVDLPPEPIYNDHFPISSRRNVSLTCPGMEGTVGFSGVSRLPGMSDW